MIKYLTKDEFRRLLRAIKNPRDRAIVTVSYWRGLRASEPGTLQFNDFRMDPDRPNLGRLRVHRKKNSIGGDYLLNPDETKAIRAWLKIRGKGSGPLFPSNRRTGISRRQLDKLFKQWGAAAEIPEDKRHFHVLKHSICTHLRQQGMDLLLIQQWVGHRNINSTAQYTHLVDNERDDLTVKVFEQW